jgi:hypothetical protein
VSVVEGGAVFTWSQVTLEQLESALLAAVENYVRGTKPPQSKAYAAVNAKSLASSGVQQHGERKVTLRPK